ncbi:MAG: sulfatase-like hydrolase/transferase, partial [bacterium]|nr:sulfatase-like hydrolase/transferase [bacterium]
MTGRPNILHLFVDQQRADTIAALGNPVIKTPSLDRLCAMGTAFTSAYSPSPVCISARCSMIYGQYPLHTGCYENTAMPADATASPDGRQTFMGVLTEAGYRTHGIGKCHFNPNGHGLRGFQSRERQEEGGHGAEVDEYSKFLYDQGWRHVLEPHGVRGEMYYIPQPSQLPARLHPTQWIGDRAIDFIDGQAGKTEPWYLFSSFIHPHPPFTPPNPWHKIYRAPLMPLPSVPQDAETLLTCINRIQNRYKYRDQGIDRNLLRNQKAFYYACISFIDFQIGRILAALEKNGQLENTLILFTSDHGEHLGDNNCFGKRSMHDAASRVPMIACLPGRFAAGARCVAPASLVDVAPTFLSAAGAELKTQDRKSVDLADLAAGTAGREMVFAQHAWPGLVTAPAADRETLREMCEDRAVARAATSQYMAVSREWKYFYSAADQREFLFDRVGDPRETRNRAGLVFCADAQRRMKVALIEHLRTGGETAGLAGDDWRRFPRYAPHENPDDG